MSHIQVKNVSKLYSSNQLTSGSYALDVVNFDIKKGEFFCILGPSGCGKTTLLNIIAGFEDPTNGKVVLDGVEIKKPSPKNVVVFQDHGLFPWKTVWDNIMFPMEFTNLSRGEKEERIKGLLSLVGLEGEDKKMPRELSGGMRQRVAIARALVVQPDMLLMDEPFASLDEMTRIRLEQELLGIWKEKGMTVIFVTHNIDSAIQLGDRVSIMTPSPGRVKKIIDIKLPRPRILVSPEYEKIKSNVLVEFGLS